MKITKRQLRKIIREAVEEMEEFPPDYQQASWKLDRILPEDDFELYDVFEELMNTKNRAGLVDFLVRHGKGGKLAQWADSDDATWEGLADHLLA